MQLIEESESRDDRLDRLKEFAKQYNFADRPVGIALFAGCGGMSLGFKNAGLHVPGYVELDSSVRRTYEMNFPEAVCLGHDVLAIGDDEVKIWKKTFRHVDVLFGGPPCQGFSMAGSRDILDSRNELYLHFTRIASILKPTVCVFENVRGIVTMKSSDGSKVIHRIIEAFSKIGYSCFYQVLNAQDFGVPQSRNRVFIIAQAHKNKNRFVFPEPTHGSSIRYATHSFSGKTLKPYRTFRDACGDLESLERDKSSKLDKFHFAIKHSDYEIELMKDVPEGESAHNNPNPELRPRSAIYGYPETYKRLCWDKPSTTIVTEFQSISNFSGVHPTNTRAITIREAARLQTFPDDFEFCGTLRKIRNAIGNAVPPKLAEVIGRHLLNTII